MIGLVALLIFSIGFLSGWLGFLVWGDMAEACTVLVISKEAVLKKEEERLKGSNESLFFGKPDQALAEMTNLARSFENKQTKVIFVSEDSGSVKGGIGISDLIHQKVIERLQGEGSDGNRRDIRD
jgi:hypothetical protein